MNVMKREDVKETLYWQITVTYRDGETDTYYSPRVNSVDAVNGMVGILSNDRIRSYEITPMKNK